MTTLITVRYKSGWLTTGYLTVDRPACRESAGVLHWSRAAPQTTASPADGRPAAHLCSRLHLADQDGLVHLDRHQVAVLVLVLSVVEPLVRLPAAEEAG